MNFVNSSCSWRYLTTTLDSVQIRSHRASCAGAARSPAAATFLPPLTVAMAAAVLAALTAVSAASEEPVLDAPVAPGSALPPALPPSPLLVSALLPVALLALHDRHGIRATNNVSGFPSVTRP